MQLYRRDVTHSRLENRVWAAGMQAWGWGGGTAQSSQPAVSWDRTPGRSRGEHFPWLLTVASLVLLSLH